jgi:hypothetical protein
MHKHSKFKVNVAHIFLHHNLLELGKNHCRRHHHHHYHIVVYRVTMSCSVPFFFWQKITISFTNTVN